MEAKNEVLEIAESCRPTVVSVGIGSDDMTDATCASLALIPSLRELTISGANDETLKKLQPLRRLEKLTLDRAKIDHELAGYLREFDGLSELTLSYGRYDRAVFENIGSLASVRTIKFWCWFEGLQDSDVLHILELPNLESLAVTNSKITSEVVDAIAKCHSLKSLNLQGTEIGGKDLRALSALGNLESLWLDNVNDDQIQHLAASFPNLSRFSTRSPLTDKALPAISQLKELEYLSITACDITVSETDVENQLPSLKYVFLSRATPR